MRNLISCAYVTFTTSLFVVTGFASADDADFRSLKRVNVADPPNLGEAALRGFERDYTWRARARRAPQDVALARDAGATSG